MSIFGLVVLRNRRNVGIQTNIIPPAIKFLEGLFRRSGPLLGTGPAGRSVLRSNRRTFGEEFHHANGLCAVSVLVP